MIACAAHKTGADRRNPGMRQRRSRLAAGDPGVAQEFARKVEPSDRSVLVEVAQDVGELQRTAEVMRKLQAVGFPDPENAHGKPADRARHAIAIKIEPGQVGCADVPGCIHLHTVDDRQEVFLAQPELGDDPAEGATLGVSAAGIKRLDFAAPARKPGQTFAMRRGRIGDVVDAAAERVDFEHAVALCARQDSHGEIERTAGRAARGTRLLIVGPKGEIGHGKHR